MQIIEWVIVVIIFLFQLRFFLQTRQRIRDFKTLIPADGVLAIKPFEISMEDLQMLPPNEILSKISQYSASELPKTPIHLLVAQKKLNENTQKIINGINVYLLRNRGAASDFNLIKDIVERHCDAVEEDINLTTPVPLYLGLMATMAGIVLGLWNVADLSDIFNEARIGNSINILLAGVKVAMIASFAGLSMTVFISGWLFKGAKSLVEVRKNDFYTLIQTELLPVLNQSVSSSLYDLQRSFAGFTQDFKAQIGSLGGLITHNSDALLAQKDIFESLENIDIAAFAQANVTVLRELQISTKELNMFNVYLKNLEGFVTQSKQIIDRTDNLAYIAENLNTNFEVSRRMLAFLENHFTKLDEHKMVFEESISKIDNSLSQTLDGFERHLQEKIRNFKESVTWQEAEMVKALSENRTNLGKLSFLEDLNRHVGELKSHSNVQGTAYQNELKNLNETIHQIQDLVANEINKETAWQVVKRKVFGVKNKNYVAEK